ncbi:squalene synthase HpnC [Micromonospora zhanjiangensis]|uniref:Squalene synthase HpnC n=1 Tax=Micromonospora zhanjiangensis TaxID=1522057 RepID=A0ABV8KR06_9ACTN
MLELTRTGPGQPSPASVAGRRSPESALAGENFPVALRVLPERVRRHLLAIYTYARFVDDVGDEPGAGGTATDDAAARLSTLRRIEVELRGLYAGVPSSHPVLIRLAPTVTECRLPIGPLLRLIEANRRDQEQVRYATFDDLVDYCRLSADPVGELVLHVFGAASPGRIALSDRICTALQVVEHLQDVGEDYRRGRIYLPADELARFGVAEEQLAAPHAGGLLRYVIQRQADRAAGLLAAGTPLVGQLRGWARLAVAGYVAGGRATLAALRRADYDPLPGPPRPTRWTTAGHLAGTLLRPGAPA